MLPEEFIDSRIWAFRWAAMIVSQDSIRHCTKVGTYKGSGSSNDHAESRSGDSVHGSGTSCVSNWGSSCGGRGLDTGGSNRCHSWGGDTGRSNGAGGAGVDSDGTDFRVRFEKQPDMYGYLRDSWDSRGHDGKDGDDVELHVDGWFVWVVWFGGLIEWEVESETWKLL